MWTRYRHHPPHSPEDVRERLIHANQMLGMSWERLGENCGVPGGTLWAIANGMRIPRKWKVQLGVKVKLWWERDTEELRWAIENREEI